MASLASGGVPVAASPTRQLLSPSIPFAEARLGECTHDLSHAVWPEVQAQHAVAGADASVCADERGGDELVGLAAGVCLAGGCGRIVAVVLGAAVHQQVIGGLGALPAMVAVHREVAAHHAGDPPDARLLTPAFDGLEVSDAGGGRGVASVGDAVQDQLLGAELGCQVDHRVCMVELGVNTAVGGQSEQVHSGSRGQRGAQHVIVGERTVGDGVVDPRDRLRHHSSGS